MNCWLWRQTDNIKKYKSVLTFDAATLKNELDSK